MILLFKKTTHKLFVEILPQHWYPAGDNYSQFKWRDHILGYLKSTAYNKTNFGTIPSIHTHWLSVLSRALPDDLPRSENMGDTPEITTEINEHQ